MGYAVDAHIEKMFIFKSPLRNGEKRSGQPHYGIKKVTRYVPNNITRILLENITLKIEALEEAIVWTRIQIFFLRIRDT